MNDAPYFKPHHEGPMFPDDTAQLIEDAETFLRAADRDVVDAVARRNIQDRAEESLTLWLGQKLSELDISLPASE